MSSLYFTVSSCIWFVQVSLVATQGPSDDPPPYELIVERNDPSTQGSGVDLITLRCRESDNEGGGILAVQLVKFWLNRTRPNDPDLKEEDYVFTNRDNMGITFQLRQEGYYTCGMQTDAANVEESERVTVISKLLPILLLGVTPTHSYAQDYRQISKDCYWRL